MKECFPYKCINQNDFFFLKMKHKAPSLQPAINTPDRKEL